MLRPTRSVLAWAIMAASSVCSLVAVAAQPGGQTRFRVEPDARGVWSFVAPSGERFVSLGINNVSPWPHEPREGTRYYDAARRQFGGDLSRWGASVASLLRGHGFNTLGCWSSLEIPTDARAPLYRTHILYIAGHAQDRPLLALAPDFEQIVRTNTREAMKGVKDRENLIGVFLDNEAAWWGKTAWDKLPTYTLLDVALEKDTAGVARRAAVDFLRARHKTPAALGEAYARPLASWDGVDAAFLRGAATPAALADRTAFTAMVASRFFERAVPVVRKELPDMLLLGVRFAGDAPDAVIEAVGRHVDVMSVNIYEHRPRASVERLTRMWVLGRRPIMVTEWSFRARENQSGNPNSRGAGPVLETQAQRAAAYSATVEDNLAWPMVIGMHWFEFSDQSPQGRFDGEDSNYGVVDVDNRPYEALLAAMKATHDRVPGIRASISRTAPTELPPPARIVFAPGQFPDRPPTLDLLAAPTRDPETWSAPDAGAGWSRRGTALVMGYDAGEQWGAGLNVFGPATSRTSRGPAEITDLDGYSTLVFEMTAPKGLMFNATLVEAGADFPGRSSYDSGTPADGEAYQSRPFFGTGERQVVRIDLGELDKQTGFGNQTGNNRVDTMAVRTLGLHLQGTPRRGEVVLHRITLEK